MRELGENLGETTLVCFARGSELAAAARTRSTPAFPSLNLTHLSLSHADTAPRGAAAAAASLHDAGGEGGAVKSSACGRRCTRP